MVFNVVIITDLCLVLFLSSGLFLCLFSSLRFYFKLQQTEMLLFKECRHIRYTAFLRLNMAIYRSVCSIKKNTYKWRKGKIVHLIYENGFETWDVITTEALFTRCTTEKTKSKWKGSLSRIFLQREYHCFAFYVRSSYLLLKHLNFIGLWIHTNG